MAGLAAGALALVMGATAPSSVPSKPLPKAVVLQAMHNDGIAQANASKVVTQWLNKSWCAPLSHFTVYSRPQWYALSGPPVKTPSPLLAAYSASSITPVGSGSFTIIPGYCHFYVHTPVVTTTTGQVGHNPYPISAPKGASARQTIAAVDSNLPVAVGPIRYTTAHVELEVSYAISQGGRIAYHHALYLLTAQIKPGQQVMSASSLIGGGEWQSAVPSYSPSYVVPGPAGGTQLPVPPKMVKL